MSAYIHTLIFGIYPYIALTILILGSIIRYEYEPYTWRSGSSQMLRRKQLIWGSILFHLGVLVIFAGHMVGLLTPIWVFDAIGISHTAKQLLAVIAGGLSGLMAIAGATLLIHRRLFDARIRATSRPTDTLIICLLGLQLLLGIGTVPISFQHLDGGEMIKFMYWAQGIFTFNTDAPNYIREASLIFKLHIFLGLTIFVLFPFTRLVHMLSIPLRYLWRPGYQVVRTRNTSHVARTRRSGAR